MNKEIKEIREYIACPQLDDDHYGEWGALRLDQRIKIKQLLDYITNLEKENSELLDKVRDRDKLIVENIQLKRDTIDKAIEYIEDRFTLDKETGGYHLTHTFDCDNICELYLILKGSDSNEYKRSIKE